MQTEGPRSHFVLYDKNVPGANHLTGLSPLQWTNSASDALAVNQGNNVSVKVCEHTGPNCTAGTAVSGDACMLSIAPVSATGAIGDAIIPPPGCAPSCPAPSPTMTETTPGQYNFNLETAALLGLYKIGVLCSMSEDTPAAFINVNP